MCDIIFYMKKIVYIVLIILIIIIAPRYIRPIPFDKDISYSDIDFYSKDKAIQDWIAKNKPKVIFNPMKDRKTGYEQKDIYSQYEEYKTSDGKYKIEFYRGYGHFSSDSGLLFEFEESLNKNRPVIYSKDNYVMFIVDMVGNQFDRHFWNILVYDTNTKKTYNFDLNVDDLNLEKYAYNINEFELQLGDFLDIKDGILYVPFREYTKRNYILSYNINTQHKEIFAEIQNPKCNNINFVVDGKTLFWQESYHSTSLFSDLEIDPICKSYRKNIE